jgi:hypothetical protein
MTPAVRSQPPVTRIYLEVGKQWVFAVALDWPGWSRRAKGEEAAIELLLEYAARYRAVAGFGFKPGHIEVVGRVSGTMTTDFGAPDAIGPWDTEKLHGAELERFITILESSWKYFDETMKRAPATLAKGPRGGGRDRDQIRDHVREAERGWSSKLGRRIPPRTPWDEQRVAIVETLRAGAPTATWPVRYALRRAVYHVMDHAWEIEDKGS